MGSEGIPEEPIHETLFQIEYNICKEFPAMSPIQVDEMTFHDVIRLYSKIRRLQIREEDVQDILTNPNRKVMVPAGDKWF